MQHYYHTIGEDWFSYPNLYKTVVEKFDNAKFVEVGSWKGRSSVFMAVEILNSNKNIEFYCVDTWKGSDEHQHLDILKDDGLYKEFLKNISPVSNFIKPIRLPSIEASKKFDDESLDFIFIDADHTYEAVRNDMISWYPKLKRGGIFAGHDYWSGTTIERAVNEWAHENNKNFHVSELCWIFEK